MNHTRLPKEVHVPDWARWDKQVIKRRLCRSCTSFVTYISYAAKLSRGTTFIVSHHAKIVNPPFNVISINNCNRCGPGSMVGIATAYRLDGPGIKSRWSEIFRTCPDRPWGPPSLLYNGYQVFPGVRCCRSVMLTPHPLLVQRSKIE